MTDARATVEPMDRPQMFAVSTFSGVGGLDLGAELGGVHVVAQCESVPWRRRVLAARFPGSPVYSDVRELDPAVFGDPWDGGEREGGAAAPPDGDGARDVRADILIGGFPCQDLSVAGKRKGLSGRRSGLYYELIRLLRDAGPVRPKFVLLENVPGLLSSCSCSGCRKCSVLLRWHQRRGCPGAPGPDGADAGDGTGAYGEWVAEGGCEACAAAKEIRKRHAGTDFAVVCAALGNLGYSVSYRILNSRHFGVAQRRRRVFILAEFNSGSTGRPEVLLEPEGGVGDPLACGAPWEGAAAALARRARGGRDEVGEAVGGVPGGSEGADTDAGLDPHYYIEDHEDGTLRGDPGRYDRQPILPVTAFDARNGQDNGDLASTLQRKGSLNAEPLLAVPADETASTLTKGSANAGVSAPGRHKEDDENLVVYEVVPGDIRHHGPNTLQAKEVSEAATLGASDAKKSDRGTLVAEGFAQGHQGQISNFEEEVPAITAGGETVRNNSPMLYEPAGALDHPAPKLASPPQVAATLKAQRGKAGGGIGPEETLIAEPTTYSKAHGAADTEDAEKWQESDEARTLNSLQHATDVVVEPVAFESRFARNGRGAPTDEVPPLKAESGSTGKGDGAPLVMAVSENQRRELRESDDAPSLGEPSGHMGQGLPSVREGAAVRRLTPTECERLQGFPDGWTAIDGDATPDGPRYAALGDAVTVNVAQWIIARLVRRRELGLE